MSAIPPDDPNRVLAVANPDDPALTNLALVGDTYTILITGKQTAGRYALIDMLVPPGGGPPPHRHDFEEMFHVLEGEIEVSLRGEPTTARTGETVNVPANAPHSFRNASDAPTRLLCMVSPAGLEEFFMEFAPRVDSRTAPAPELDDWPERMAKAGALAAQYRVDIVAP